MSDSTALVGAILGKYDEALHHHDYFTRLYERRERAYRGVKERIGREKWNHTLKPPHAFNLLETVVASQTEMGLRWDVRPSPHSQAKPDEAGHMLAMAEDVNDLIRHEDRLDGMDQKQRPLFLCDGIGGRGIGKNYWNYVPGMTKKQGVREVDIHGPNDEVIGTVPTIVEIHEEGILRDHSYTEVVDPRDFVWHESARDLDPRAPGGAQHVTHRCWYSFEQLKELEKIGFVSNIDKLKETRSFTGEYQDRDTQVFNIERTKDLIEVLEHWWFEDGEIWYAWVANRDTLIMPKTANPFWHGEYPFFMVTSMPQPFSLTGTSTIELIQDLQEILWELGNQRLDTVELINNAITLIRGDVDDPDAFQHYPGARWEVDDPSQVQWLAPPYQIAEVSLSAESKIMSDLQTVTSGAPFAGGDSSSVQNNTATGASIVMNAAQRQLATRKYQAQFGLVKNENMRLKNCQQFLTGQRLVQVLGKEGAAVFKSIDVLAIQGEYAVELKPMGESDMRQERRAEATSFAQLMIGFAPIAAASGKPLDVEAIIKWFAGKWDIDYPERFFSKQPAAMGAQAGLPGAGSGPGDPSGAPGAPAPPGGGPNLGTTSETAVDASKPSASGGLSMSPQVFMQRAAALSGGAQGG